MDILVDGRGCFGRVSSCPALDNQRALSFVVWIGTWIVGLGGGVVALGYVLYSAGSDASIPQAAFWALAVLAAAFLGGALLFGVLFRQGKPRWAMVAHGGLALTGLVVLFFAGY
ncbi:hypothetical protein RBK60_19035 [Pseudomonas aeruginosa]|uniref:hypothetical protein n=1 Tax=Pseudomonas aeruginosa TaxID=287 RepID=UPI00163CF4F1|nr:hypothetical protein [Pseudomonas aeruginosa]MCY4797036.1 hypothetical protein [Pseudomonas aeruginosa]MDZ5161816.1 hypothetical protein [Pseudomonas aeruginosa]MDZ5172998.1 hypothetical protein [Pseudomonas aeruginosa]MDZ5183892.1 hypothetical protein [Pseudomonas aeruginosa]MDZ5189207.1 hypothetical protein [Pseudomonas aeruginosa]